MECSGVVKVKAPAKVTAVGGKASRIVKMLNP